jgi:branched-chain amino acid transport system permease protein
MFFSLLIEGIAVGSIYSLVAVGFIILVQTTDVVNFAHGDLLMFSTFIAYLMIVQLGLPTLVGIGITIIFAALAGVLIEKVLIKPIIDRSHEAVILATLGLAFILRGFAAILWSDKVYPFPRLFKDNDFFIGELRVDPQNIGIIVAAIVIISVLYIFIKFTKVGTGLRAVNQNKQAAQLMGIPLNRVFSIAWAIGGAMAAIAGILLAPRIFLSTNMGHLTFIAIIACIIGGFGNLFGAIIGGYLLGILQTVLPLYIPQRLQGLIPYALLIIVLFVRPTGILGRVITKKV